MTDCTVPVQVKHTYRLELGENAFWLAVWTMVASAALAFFAILFHYSHRTDELIARSRDPIETRCALGVSQSLTQQCQALILAAARDR